MPRLESPASASLYRLSRSAQGREVGEPIGSARVDGEAGVLLADDTMATATPVGSCQPEQMSGRAEEQAKVLAARLAAQRLSGRPAADTVEVTRHLLAVQAQDPRAARLAVRARTSGGYSLDVDRALTEKRSLVVTWVNRGTLHLIAAEDEPLLHALTTPQLRKANDRRLSHVGVTPAALVRGIEIIKHALSEEGPMTRVELRDRLDRADVPTGGQALVHILFGATLEGLIVRGPIVGTEHAFVLAQDWLGPRPRLDRDRALAELARRYLKGHGPADARDLAKWAGLPLRDARAGLAAIAGSIDQRPDGLLDLRHRAPTQPSWPAPRLLGPFDPLLLGWRSRALVLDDPQEVVTTNGIIKPIVLIDGRAAGTWAMTAGRVTLNLWNDPDTTITAALANEAIAIEGYLSVPDS
jgi:Winged helix DNA-binding domain